MQAAGFTLDDVARKQCQDAIDTCEKLKPMCKLDLYLQAMGLQTKLIGNLDSNPKEAKYRSINAANKVLNTKLFNVIGIDKVLTLIGFDFDKKTLMFTWPENRDTRHLGHQIEWVGDDVEKIYDDIANQRGDHKPVNWDAAQAERKKIELAKQEALDRREAALQSFEGDRVQFKEDRERELYNQGVREIAAEKKAAQEKAAEKKAAQGKAAEKVAPQ